MKIIINYTGEGIQPYSIEFELDENNIPKTDVDWKKLALEKSNADSIYFIYHFTFSSEPSSNNSRTANVVLSKRDQLSNLPPEALEQILTNLSLPELVANQKISKYLAKQINLTPMSVFIQSPSNWRLSCDQIEQAIKPLKHPENIKRLLELVNIWLKTQQGIERFLAWIDTFHNHFVAVYNSLATARAAEHEALFALITDNVTSLDLKMLDTTAKKIGQNYPAVGASLNSMQTFLGWKNNRHILQSLPENWRNTATTCYCNLQGLDFQSLYSEEPNLQGANLQKAKLENTMLDKANLQGANLREANLQNAILDKANLQGAFLQGAFLQGARLNKATFQGANLQGAFLQGAFLKKATFQGANLQGAFLQDAFLKKATFQGANLQGAFLQDALLNKATFQGANLQGAFLQDLHLSWAYLQGVDLQGAHLQGAYLQGAKLQGAKLPEVNLQKVMLHKIDLQGAYLLKANFGDASLAEANLKEANLQDADLQWADLREANLEDANLTGAIFNEFTNLYRCNFAGANMSNITWPDGLLLKAKNSTLEILQARINSANIKDLMQIYEQNNKENHIFDVKRNPGFDAVFSFFFGSNKLTDHRKLFNEAICKRISELLQSLETTQDDKKALQQLQQTVNPDSAASSTNLLRI